MKVMVEIVTRRFAVTKSCLRGKDGLQPQRRQRSTASFDCDCNYDVLVVLSERVQ